MRSVQKRESFSWFSDISGQMSVFVDETFFGSLRWWKSDPDVLICIWYSTFLRVLLRRVEWHLFYPSGWQRGAWTTVVLTANHRTLPGFFTWSLLVKAGLCASAVPFFQSCSKEPNMPGLLLGDEFPNFEAHTTIGKIKFHDFLGSS